MAKTIQVSTATQLVVAAKAAGAGDTILLAAGDYGAVSLNNLHPAAMVTIRSADLAHEASFYAVGINVSNNLTVRDVVISHPLNPGDSLSVAAVTINKSSGITLANLQISGSLDGSSFNDGNGIIATSSDHLTIVGSTFRQLHGAVLAARVTDLVVAQNSVSEVREGFNLSDIHQGLFDRNYVTNMQPNYSAGDHPDAFQLSTAAGTAPSNDLSFTNNVMIEGTSGPVGGIFIRSESGPLHARITIQNNFYEGTYRNAIAVSDANDVRIAGNTVLDSSKAGNSAAIIVGDLHNAVISGNIAPLLMTRTDSVSTGVAWQNNIDVWDAKTKVGIQAALLVSSQQSGNIDFSTLGTLAGSIADRVGAGYHPVAGVGAMAMTGTSLGAYLGLHDHLAVQIG